MYSFEDLNIFFPDFGEPIAWDGKTLDCIFDNKHDPLAFNAGGRSITAIVKVREFQGVSQGDPVVIRSQNFSVEEIHSIQDGELFKLILEQT
jgi:hypothetical protein